MRSVEKAPSRRALPKGVLPPDLTEYESYYAVIRWIPRGRVMTYGDVARWAGRPNSARRVGYALFAVKGSSVPWWRVLNARGEISVRPGAFGDCETEQRLRLQSEGVEFGPDDRVDLDRYLYRPRPRRAG